MDKKSWWKHHGKKMSGGGGGGSAIYCLGIFGALFYFWQSVGGFLDGVMAIFKALTWPAFVVFKALELLKI